MARVQAMTMLQMTIIVVAMLYLAAIVWHGGGAVW
jgi:hypothetical protein